MDHLSQQVWTISPEQDTETFCSASSTPEDTERRYGEESLLRSLPSDLGDDGGQQSGQEKLSVSSPPA